MSNSEIKVLTEPSLRVAEQGCAEPKLHHEAFTHITRCGMKDADPEAPILKEAKAEYAELR